jgi:hypothetical protein
MWFYPQDTSTGAQFLFMIGTDSNGAFQINYNRQSEGQGTQKITLNAYGGTTINSVSQIPLNQWTHIAFVRISNFVYLYINGQLDNSGSLSFNFNNTSYGISIGRPETYNSSYYKGYLSNIRLVVGTGVYTTNFTPPPNPLTAITNTQILTCQSNYFKDNSTNNYSFTVLAGSPSVQAFSPFAPTAAYLATTNGGSGYFDGSGDDLSFNPSTAINIGTSDFTVEAWVYHTGGSDKSIISNSGSFTFTYGATGVLRFYLASGSNIVDANVSYRTNEWAHVAVVRSSGTLKMYQNGVEVASSSSYPSIANSSTTTYIGRWHGGSSNFWPGYISNLRVVVGTAVYTSAFTPPTSPVTAITNTSLLINGTNAGIIDNAAKNNLETVGNAQISTTQSKFGSASMYFDGTGDYLFSYNQPVLGTQNWTLEGWIYPTSVSALVGIYTSATTTGGDNGNIRLGLNSAALWFDLYSIGGGSGGTVSANTWSHVAFVRNGAVITAYLNGTSVASYTYTTTTAITGPNTVIGRVQSGGYYFPGYMDDLRLTVGVARYTSNFTVPSAAFPDK